MSVTRPVRCLFCRFSRPTYAVPRVPRRQFHPSPAPLSNDQNPKDPKTQEDKMAGKKLLVDIERDAKPEDFKPLTQKEKEYLATVYSPKQMESIEAGEAAIDPKDLAEQFAFQRGPLRHHYADDFASIEPGVDKHVRAPISNTDYNAKLKSEEDFIEDFGRFFAEMPEDVSASDWVRFVEGLRVTHGKPENELAPHSSLVPDLFQPGESLEQEEPKEPRPEVVTTGKVKEGEGMDPTLRKLLMATGYTESFVNSLKTKVLVRRSVVNQTRLGKIRKASVLAIAGNGKGLLGIGEGKSAEFVDAVTQARYRAIRNMQPIPRYEQRTIFGDVRGKVGAVELILMNRPPGFGLRCQHLIYEMCLAAGIHDLAARVERSRNPMNTVKAAYEALMSQRNPEEIARARGRKLVDVRAVYYSGRAY
ncbi:hypothetical protein PHISCL_09474 [Aspergillus sclerotialis]|uniref:Small ribosomal subunit protein uS5m n=1 Tax=Aspergillus sclerotialis TaxID=2070753 RepID=A0A3A2Z7M7_9EURO|nr:hypothetical protein PHISCL_09474 [Aspergillus sclerotialis]